MGHRTRRAKQAAAPGAIPRKQSVSYSVFIPFVSRRHFKSEEGWLRFKRRPEKTKGEKRHTRDISSAASRGKGHATAEKSHEQKTKGVDRAAAICDTTRQKHRKQTGRTYLMPLPNFDLTGKVAIV